MIALLAAAALIVVPPQSAEESGRSAFHAGMCSAFGWQIDESQADVMWADLTARFPDRSRAELEAGVARGVDEAQAEVEAIVDGVDDLTSFHAFATHIEKACQAVVRDYPALLQRTAETDARWARFLADGEAAWTKP